MKNISERNEEYNDKVYNVAGENKTGNALNVKISRLKNKDRTPEEETEFNRLKGEQKTEINKIYDKKDNMKKTGAPGPKKGGNHFKNRDPNAAPTSTVSNPASVGEVPDMKVKGSRSRVVDQLGENKGTEFYESYEKEMENMKYLMEYMNNNEGKII